MSRSFLKLLVIAAICANRSTMAAPAQDLTTLAEQTKYQRTGRYEEVERLCPAFQTSWPTKVRCIEFGVTPEGRKMLALVASGDGTLDAASARKKQRPVVVMQGGIHAGEIDGKDAGLRALRELLESKVVSGAPLNQVTFVFVPVLNIDGHERFGKWNRPNQVGPEEMGWRTTGQNYNLNRDYVKADAPETQALLRLLNEWDPVLYVDLHVTDGADFEHDISISTMPTLAGDAQLVPQATQLTADVLQRLSATGSLPLSFYPSFVDDDDPTSGFAASVTDPRFSHAYWARRNRIGILVETHSWKDYLTRVRITRNTVVALLELAARDGANWLQSARVADDRAAKLGGTEVALTYENNDHVTMVAFRGYAYTREASAVSGALVTRYDPTRPQTFQLPLKDEVKPAVTVVAPRGGYLISPAHAKWVGEKLALHGIAFRKLTKPGADLDVEVFRAVTAKTAPTLSEGHTRLSLTGAWQTESRDIPVNSLFVPIEQARAPLIMTLLEPTDPDSLVSWGFFNAAFEHKEYMEAYVAEQVAKEMLARDPALKREFERRLASEPEFAKNPEARLEFFYRRHPSWDERFNLYPIFRIARVP